MRREIRIPDFGTPVSHYTEAVRFGDLLFVSGLVAWDSEHRVIAPGDAVAQTRRIFADLGVILAEAGCGFEDVLKVNVFLTDVDDRPRIDPVRREVFGETRPASTLVQVAALVHPDLCVEIECVAGIPPRG